MDNQSILGKYVNLNKFKGRIYKYQSAYHKLIYITIFSKCSWI